MENSQLTLADLASLKNIVEAASARGVFKASELRAVGEVYDKLTIFLEMAAQQNQAPATEQQPAAEPTQGEQNA